jgi:hypothetical protein
MSRGESMGTPSRVNNYFIFLFLVERYFNKNKFHDISPGLLHLALAKLDPLLSD